MSTIAPEPMATVICRAVQPKSPVAVMMLTCGRGCRKIRRMRSARSGSSMGWFTSRRAANPRVCSSSVIRYSGIGSRERFVKVQFSAGRDS